MEDEKSASLNGAADAADGKEKAILQAISQRNLRALRALAESPGGLLTDSLRQQAWPLLLGLPPSHDKSESDPPTAASADSWRALPRHKDEDQVQLDVDRAFVYYPNHQSEAQLASQKAELSDLIVEVLRRHPYLCYFQGYHDIAQVLLLVLPPATRAAAVLSHLSHLRIRDFMLPSLAPAIAQLRLIPDILRLADPPLWEHLALTEPFFALSGTLTMYAHDVTTLPAIARLFDALLARDPAFTVYLFAAIVASRRAELFAAAPRDEPEVLHSVLAKLPQQPPDDDPSSQGGLDLEALIAAARRLEERFPPERLPSWRGISRWSVLKTARRRAPGRDGGDDDEEEEEEEEDEEEGGQSIEQGRLYFEKQVQELRWAETKARARQWLWRHRRPARTIGFAILVGLVAVLLRRGSAPATLVSGLGYVSGLLARWWWR
ncbi:hypothetical protein VTK56DRAFT_6359 [Thermocarpiscus australiensis]